MKITPGRIAFAVLVLLGVIYVCAPMLHAQGSSGFTKINTAIVTASPYLDTTCPVGASCTYQVTSVNGAQESGPSNTSNAGVPTAALPNIQLTWTASVSNPAGYNVYRNLVQPLLPPTGVGAAIHN